MELDLDYIAEIMPGAMVECSCPCGKMLALSAVVWADNKPWCSQVVADRETAIFHKPQPKGNQVVAADGKIWDV